MKADTAHRNYIKEFNPKDIYLPFKIKIDKRVRLAVCGVNHSTIVTNDLSVFSWGLGVNGRLGIRKKGNSDM